MSRQQQFRVIDEKGVKGTVLTTSRFLDENSHRLVRHEDGRELLVPRQMLRPQEDGSFLLAASFDDLLNESDPQIIPVMQEELEVSKRVVESGRIRVNKKVETTESVIDEPLLQQSYDIETISINRIVDEVPQTRYDGSTLILPILEEVLVVEKRLVLREEVRITPKSEVVREPQTHNVRREQIHVERV